MSVIRICDVTKMVNVCVALRLGEPSSATWIRRTLVLGAWLLPGVQLKTPVTGSTVALAGAPEPRLKVRTWAGKSVSRTTFVKVSNWLAATVLVPMGDSTGAELDSVTMIVNR